MQALKNTFIGAALALLASSSMAGGGAGFSIVYDPTNFSKNAITAAQTARQVAEQIESKLVLVRQYNEMVRLGKQASDDLLRAGGPVVGKENLLRDINTLLELKSRVESLRTTLLSLDRRQREVTNMANSAGLTTQKFIDKAVSSVRSGDVSSARILEENSRVMADVNNAYQSVQEWERNNPGQSSQLAAIQNMNQQMSALVRMNARLIEYQAQTSSTQIQNQREKEAEEAISRAKIDNLVEKRDDDAKRMQSEMMQIIKNAR